MKRRGRLKIIFHKIRAKIFAALMGGALCLAGLPLSIHADPSPRHAHLSITVTVLDQNPPAAVTDLTALPGTAEGSIVLQWTAPDEDSPTPSGAPVNLYQIRYATFSADSVGSTTTWWNAAQDVTGEPIPLMPGSTQSMPVTGLDAGAAFYFALRSQDASGNISPLDGNAQAGGSPQAGAMATDLPPPAPGALIPFAAAGTNQVVLSWNPISVPDLAFYRIYRDTAAPADNFSLLAETTSTTYVDGGLSGPNTYYYRVSAVDKPPLMLESPLSPWTTAYVIPILIPPSAPGGLKADMTQAADRNIFSLNWSPVTANFDGTSFGAPAVPAPRELAGYRIYQATSPWGAWTAAGTVDRSTTAWSVSLPVYEIRYYKLRAYDSEPSESEDSMIADTFLNLYAFAKGADAEFKCPSAVLSQSYEKYGVFTVQAYRKPQDIGGHIVESVQFEAVDPNDKRKTVSRLALSKPEATITLRYENPLLSAPSPSSAPAPENLGLYWNNGSRFLKVYGTQNPLTRSLSVKTAYLGTYQIRALVRGTEFDFNPGSVSNRYLTPNGDQKNDTAIFIFDNPKDSLVTGKIYDMTGAFVSEMQAGPLANTLQWDGKSNGRTVSSGIYVYQIQSEGKTFNGTIVVVR